MDIFKLTVQWTGFIGAPGYTNFFFAGGGGLISDAQQVADRVDSGMSNLRVLLPRDVTIGLSSEVQVIDSDTGELTGYQNVDVEDASNGVGDGAYSAASGAVINWRTNDVRFGRRIRGRTFIVPLAGEHYDDDGTLSDQALGYLRGFAGIMTSADFDSEFGVWSRPRNGTGGVFASVTGFNVPDMAAVLRSRRD